MIISHLKEHFDVEHFHLVEKSCYISMVNGVLVVAKYAFRNTDGETKGRSTAVEMVTTQPQRDALLTLLQEILQATNAEIKNRTGWTKWVEPEPEP